MKSANAAPICPDKILETSVRELHCHVVQDITLFEISLVSVLYSFSVVSWYDVLLFVCSDHYLYVSRLLKCTHECSFNTSDRKSFFVANYLAQ